MKQHQILNKYISGLINNYSNSLVIVGPAGLGKSETAINALKQANLREGEHYIYLTNYLTPKALVGLLDRVNKLSTPRILVIDEAEHILNNLEIIGVLKSCLWEVNGKRKVYWITSKEHLEFEFNGKIVFILNKINEKSQIVRALIDRSLFYEIKLNNQEIIELLEERVKQPYFEISYQDRLKVFNFIKTSANGSKRLSLRILPKAFQSFLISPNHWQSLVSELL